MKKISLLKVSILCLSAFFTATAISSCDKKDDPELPNTPETPDTPGTVDYLNILDLDGFFLSGITEGADNLFSITYKDFNSKYGRPNIIDISNNNATDNNQLVINYKDKNFTENKYGNYLETSLNYTPQGFLSGLGCKRQESGLGLSEVVSKDIVETYDFKYSDGQRLSQVSYHYSDVFESYKIEGASNVFHSETDLYVTYSFTWNGNNIVKIEENSHRVVVANQQSGNKDESETTEYRMDYDSSLLNEAGQYPLFVSQFLMGNDKSRTPLPMLGVLGKFSKNLPVKVTVVKDGNVVETNNIVFTQTKVNGFNVIGSELYKGTTYGYQYKKGL